MKNRLLLTAALLLSSSCSSVKYGDHRSSAQEQEVRTIAVGSVELLEFEAPELQPIVGNRGVLSVAPGRSPRQLQVLPIAKGSSTLLLLDGQGKLLRKLIYNVVSNDLSARVLGIRRLLSGVSGITVEELDDRIVVDGALTDLESVVADYDRILHVHQAHSDVVLNLVRISPAVYEQARRRMQERIGAIPGGGAIRVEYINGTYLLSGRTDSARTRELAEAEVMNLLPPMLGSDAIRENALVLGARKYSIRNLVEVVSDRAPAARERY